MLGDAKRTVLTSAVYAAHSPLACALLAASGALSQLTSTAASVWTSPLLNAAPEAAMTVTCQAGGRHAGVNRRYCACFALVCMRVPRPACAGPALYRCAFPT